MFSLIITIIAVALVALLALATLYFTGPAYQAAGVSTKAATLIQQSTQVLGAAELYHVEHRSWSSSVDELIETGYLKESPIYSGASKEDVRWTQPVSGQPTYFVKKAVEEAVCEQVNLRARGDNGIYKAAMPGLVTQCFGLEAPYTVITTRQGASEVTNALDLEMIFRFMDDFMLLYSLNGGGWAKEPTIVQPGGHYASLGGTAGGSEPGSSEGGNSEGSQESEGDDEGNYVGGRVSIKEADSGSSSVVGDFGNIVEGQAASQGYQITNTSSEPLAISTPSVTGPFAVTATNCPATLAPGASCTITVQGGPISNAEPGTAQTVSGRLTVPTSGGAIGVPLRMRVASKPAAEPVPPFNFRSTTPNDSFQELLFPDTPVGAASLKWLEVINQNQTVSYSGTTASAPFSIHSNTCTGTAAAYSKCYIALKFTPSAQEEYKGAQYFFRTVANGTPYTILLSGRGQGTVVSNGYAPPADFNFGALAYNTVSTQTRTFTNNSAEAITLGVSLEVNVGGKNAFEVLNSDVNSCGLNTIPAKGSCTITVRARATKMASMHASLTLSPSNASPIVVGASSSGVSGLLAPTAALPAINLSVPAAKVDVDLRTLNWRMADGSQLNKDNLVFEAITPSNPGIGVDATRPGVISTANLTEVGAHTVTARVRNGIHQTTATFTLPAFVPGSANLSFIPNASYLYNIPVGSATRQMTVVYTAPAGMAPTRLATTVPSWGEPVVNNCQGVTISEGQSCTITFQAKSSTPSAGAVSFSIANASTGTVLTSSTFQMLVKRSMAYNCRNVSGNGVWCTGSSQTQTAAQVCGYSGSYSGTYYWSNATVQRALFSSTAVYGGFCANMRTSSYIASGSSWYCSTSSTISPMRGRNPWHITGNTEQGVVTTTGLRSSKGVPFTRCVNME